MKGFKRAFEMAACAVACGAALSGSAQAATVFAGPTVAIDLGNGITNGTFCQVLNTGTHSVKVTIKAKNDLGLVEQSKTVTLQPEQGSSLFGGSEVSGCTFTGPSAASMAGMLINVDPTTGHYSTAVLAE